MGLIERVAEARKPQAAWPVGPGVVQPGDELWGHDDSRFQDEKYEEYLPTSNEVYSAAMLRARLMSSLKLRLFDRDGPERSEITTGPAPELLQHVNPFWTRRRLALMDELSMNLWGETVWAVEKRGRMPSEIWWLKATRVKPVPDENDYIKGFVYESVTGELIPFMPDEIVWFRYPNPLDEFSALSPLAAARLAADTAGDMLKANRNLFKQGLMAGGLIVPSTDKVTFSEEQAKELEAMLDKRLKGVDKAHRWAVLRYEAQLKGLSVTPKDAEFANGLNLTLRQIGNAYGIPVTLMNDFANATLTNAREHKLLLWEHALVPDSQLRADEIVEQFLPMFPGSSRPGHAEFDYSKVPALQQAESEIWSRERQMIEVGALTINEWRKSKGLDSVDWGDVYWAPVNKGPVDEDAPPDLPASPDEPAEASQRLLAPFDQFTNRLTDAGYPALNGHRR